MTSYGSNENILIVDDEQSLLEILQYYLTSEGYTCFTAQSGEDALAILSNQPISLMLTDINMPGMDGISLLKNAKEMLPDMAVIMISAVSDRDVAVSALEHGATSYLIKPVNRNDLLINVINALRLRSLEIANRSYQESLEEQVRNRTNKLHASIQNLERSREETILRLTRAAEFRDNETAQHTVRMSYYCKILAQEYGIDNGRCEIIRLSSQLHDIGKIGIPDAILLKPGKLTADEYDFMKQHCQFGYKILAESDAELLQTGAIIAQSHHEKYDGSGYPAGLSGEDIPIEGRIAAISDVFDALTSKRVYKDAMPVDKAVNILKEEKGKHFDPQLVDTFLENMDKILEIREEYTDS